MDSFVQRIGLIAVATGIAGAMVVGSAMAQEAQSTYRDIEATLGSVPSLFKVFPEEGIAEHGPNSRRCSSIRKRLCPARKKSRRPGGCRADPVLYCIYFHTAAAKLNGATDAEVREAVAMAAITRHWSTVLNGMQVDRRCSARRPMRAASRRRADEDNSGHAVRTSRQLRPATSKGSSRQHCGAVAPPQCQKEGDYSDGKALNPGPSPSY